MNDKKGVCVGCSVLVQSLYCGGYPAKEMMKRVGCTALADFSVMLAVDTSFV